jgi:hypothetical protein
MEYRPTDFGQKVQYFALDVISSAAYEFPFGFLATDSDVYQYVETSEKVVPAATVVTVYPWLNHILTSSFMKSLCLLRRIQLALERLLGLFLFLTHLGIVERNPEHPYALRRHNSCD